MNEGVHVETNGNKKKREENKLETRRGRSKTEAKKTGLWRENGRKCVWCKVVFMSSSNLRVSILRFVTTWENCLIGDFSISQ